MKSHLVRNRPVDSIGIHDPHWRTTFPDRVLPQEGEWLLGLLLRCDEANGWFSGTTALYIARFATGPQTLSRSALFVMGSIFELPLLAERLVVTPKEIFATTFTAPLQRLYAPASPNVAQIGPSPPFRVCPKCLAQNKLLPLSLALPAIQNCPTHHLVLQTVCCCGVPLRPFSRHIKPFTCEKCGLYWSNLPQLPAEPAALKIEAKLYSLYGFFLTKGTPEIIAYALRLIRTSEAKNTKRETTEPGGSSLFKNSYYSGTVSLAFLVTNLVGQGITMEDIAWPARPFSKEERYCLNRACPLFSVVDAGNVHRYGHRDGVQEWYCNMCGSRFIGDHLCMSFDVGCHGQGNDDVYLSSSAIERAQKRLARWKQKLEATCEAMLVRGEPIAVENAFAHAGIPGTANLRATRLGLVRLVAEYAARQEQALPPEGRERWVVRTHMHRRKKLLAKQKTEGAGSGPDSQETA
ncbi:MAG TPA: TniQ family protein [Ktedonobacterales bacterium]